MINVENLTAGYGKSEILKKLSLTLEKGKLTSIIGPNGSGKTTLLKALIATVPNLSGDISIDGENLFNLKRAEKYRSHRNARMR